MWTSEHENKRTADDFWPILKRCLFCHFPTHSVLCVYILKSNEFIDWKLNINFSFSPCVRLYLTSVYSQRCQRCQCCNSQNKMKSEFPFNWLNLDSLCDSRVKIHNVNASASVSIPLPKQAQKPKNRSARQDRCILTLWILNYIFVCLLLLSSFLCFIFFSPLDSIGRVAYGRLLRSVQYLLNIMCRCYLFMSTVINSEVV